ncbi:hypothetical protein STEG23_016948, partial [Scotinomys teguina]
HLLKVVVVGMRHYASYTQRGTLESTHMAASLFSLPMIPLKNLQVLHVGNPDLLEFGCERAAAMVLREMAVESYVRAAAECNIISFCGL